MIWEQGDAIGFNARPLVAVTAAPTIALAHRIPSTSRQSGRGGEGIPR